MPLLGLVEENFDIAMIQPDQGLSIPLAPIKFVAFDIDGTLIHRGQIVEANREAILRASEYGVDLVPFTARAFPSTMELIKDLNLNGPMVCCNGAVSYQDIHGQEYWHERIPLKVAREIAGFADKKGIELCTTIGFVTYFRQRPGQKLGRWGDDRYVIEQNITPLVESPNRIMVSGQEDVQVIKDEFMDKFIGELSFRLAEEVNHSLYLIITPLQATKGHALKRICQILGYSLQETLAIGDGEADIDMFSVAGISIAVGGAPDQVVSAADHVAPPCDQAAIAWALDNFVLGP
ncbi:MAG: HAD family hydrolase [Anaerolineales bacterium]